MTDQGSTPVDEARAVAVVRGLVLDSVERARSGHPGAALALAPLLHVLYTRILSYDAGTPEWPDRDRFVLSAGHASAGLYAMLHLTGFGLTLEDLRAFRQWGSATPGHPERGHPVGTEVTTGPLGQGFANGVGFALAERHLRDRFGSEVCDHRVFALCSDGDLHEGVSHEAAALAGHLRLGRVVYVYDDNRITIDGPTGLSSSEDVGRRFEAYGWHVVRLGEVAEDRAAIEQGLREAIAEEARPSLVILRSHIGYPSPRFTDTSEAHGMPFGPEEVARVKSILGLPADEFFVPDDVLDLYRRAGTRGRAGREAWQQRRDAYSSAGAERATELEACLAGRAVEGWTSKLPSWPAGDSVATRNASRDVLAAMHDVVPGLVGGGADLTANTGTLVAGSETITPFDASGRTLHFGVREHAMGSMANAMAFAGILPFVGTFFVFSDYMRPAVRLAALSRAKVAFVFTHDSLGVGEDGPTHQPVEHLAALRAIPGLRVIRPADANEVAAAWRVHIEGEGPTALVLTRQNVPVLEGTAEHAGTGLAAGAYVLAEAPSGDPDIVLVGTGSEVALCAEARDLLAGQGVAARVVSMPSWDLFEARPPEYRRAVLPVGVPALAVEAGVGLGWERYASATVTIDRFGASAPGPVALERFGFSAANVAQHARALLGAVREGGS